MSATDRQNRLLVAEDWKRVYQSFRNADFQSYDFENLRRAMITYIRENYPEDYNDYIESSEYLALIDLIAFLGQSLSFRIDLNARDNFLELSERRESILRLARLLSYNPKRNIASSGLLKFTTVSTTQTVFDANGRNLAGQTITWNDPANANWYDQFIKVINAALPAARQFGNPDDRATINGIPTDQYRFQAINTDVPLYSFTKTADGLNLPFELVSTTFKGSSTIYEEAPYIGNRLAFLFRNDNKGYGSVNTGFFLLFKQGTLNQGTFTITQPSTNETIDIDSTNINDSDVWLYRLDQNNLESEYWAKTASTEGNNVIYNSLNKAIRNIYTVVTRAGDRVTLQFSDGTFGNLPRGTFRVYYRSSIGVGYTINPRDIRNVSISIPYVSNANQSEVLTLNLSLQNSVSNSAESETNSNIKARAPATYYTQNRMITGEDYNISPLAASQQVVKVKALNRSSSGISRYFDLVDPTGKYSKTNLFGDDGAIYSEEYSDQFRFTYATRTDIEGMIYNQLYDFLEKKSLRDFYYNKYYKIITGSLNVAWYSKTVDTNQSTGYIGATEDTVPYKLGVYSSTLLRFAVPGSILKFEAPVINNVQQYFDKSNNNNLITTNGLNSATSLWCKIISVSGDGTNNGKGYLVSGEGTVMLNDIVPSNAILTQIIPAWRTVLDTNTITTMVDLIFGNKPFGLRYDVEERNWKIIFDVNLNTTDDFSLGQQGDNSNQKKDSSWLVLFTTDTEYYTVKFRLRRYIFESDQQIRFFFDASDKIYDTRTNTVTKDKIKILSINTRPDSTIPFTFDRDWEITEEFRGLDGYVDTKKIQVTFSDTDDDGVVDNPDIFDEIVSPNVNVTSKYVVLERYTIEQGQEDYRLFDNSNSTVLIYNDETEVTNLSLFNEGQYFYFINGDTVKKLDLINGLVVSLDYIVYQGRNNLKFQYIHNADYETRIDPGLTNLIDVFILTKQYDKEFREWLDGIREAEPLPPSSDALYNLLSPELNKIKSISDEIIYHPAKYKVLFGSNASRDVQATFKIVKNAEVVISDNDVKSRVISAINEFFALDNWDFGDNFYFSELTTYVMNKLAPNIVTFILVPRDGDLSFGSLFEVRSEKDQIFISGATVDDIEIITAVTASKLQASGSITLNATVTNQQVITSSGIN
jgi:hypothetical protein